MDFKKEAEAYVNRFPALTKVILRTGAVDFNPLLPSADITLLTTSVGMAVRPGMEPALVSLLTHAIMKNPKSGFDKNGDPVLFYKPGEFPSGSDPELPSRTTRALVYKSGELPFMLRVLGAGHQARGRALRLYLLRQQSRGQAGAADPGAGGAAAADQGDPAFYIWIVRRRLLYWYNQLKSLERNLDSGGARFDPDALQAEFDRIDEHVRPIRMPSFFSQELYDLRGHIELMRQRLAPRTYRREGDWRASPCIEGAPSVRRGGRKMRPRFRLAITVRAANSTASLSRWTHQVGVTGSILGDDTPPGIPSTLARLSSSRMGGDWAS